MVLVWLGPLLTEYCKSREWFKFITVNIYAILDQKDHVDNIQFWTKEVNFRAKKSETRLWFLGSVMFFGQYKFSLEHLYHIDQRANIMVVYLPDLSFGTLFSFWIGIKTFVIPTPVFMVDKVTVKI